MSKSLGNFFTVRDVLARYDGEGLRFFLLGTHYRNDFNFSDAVLDEAERRLGYLYETLEKAERPAGDAAPAARAVRWWSPAARRWTTTSTPPRCSGCWPRPSRPPTRWPTRRGRRARGEGRSSPRSRRDARAVCGTLGVLQRPPGGGAAARCGTRRRRGAGSTRARWRRGSPSAPRRARAKDFARSDAIRDELLARGVAIMDGPEGTTWKVQ